MKCKGINNQFEHNVNVTQFSIQNSNNNSVLYLHDYNNTALQKRRNHGNYSTVI